jgi:hypothetical protein
VQSTLRAHDLARLNHAVGVRPLVEARYLHDQRQVRRNAVLPQDSIDLAVAKLLADRRE